MDLMEAFLGLCGKLSTEELFAGLHRLNDRESRSLAQIIAVLSELHKRRAAEEKGYPSLFKYCTQALGYSEDQACMRIRAAQAAAKFPSILRMIASRSLGITAISRLAPHLDSSNHRGVLAKAADKGLVEVDRIIRSIAPEPERRPVIRAIATGSDTPAVPREDAGYGSLFEPHAVEKAGPGPAPGSARPASGRVLFNFIASERFRAKFNRAKELLRHKFPQGDPEPIFEDALDGLLDRRDPERCLERKRKRRQARERRRQEGAAGPSPPGSRN